MNEYFSESILKTFKWQQQPEVCVFLIQEHGAENWNDFSQSSVWTLSPKGEHSSFVDQQIQGVPSLVAHQAYNSLQETLKVEGWSPSIGLQIKMHQRLSLWETKAINPTQLYNVQWCLKPFKPVCFTSPAYQKGWKNAFRFTPKFWLYYLNEIQTHQTRQCLS